MKKRMLFILVAVLLLVGIFALNVAAADSADIYVSSTGVDTNAGTAAAPVLSLNQALELVADGGTVHIVGTYTVPAGFVWENHNKDITITGDVLDFSQAYTAVAYGDTTLNCYIQGDAVTYNAIELVLADSSYYIANGFRLKIEDTVTVTGTDLQLCGGGIGDTVVSGTDVTLLGGNFLQVYGGGYDTKVNGSTNLYIGGNFNSAAAASHDGKRTVHGGCYKDTVAGDVNLTIAGGNVDWIYGVSDTANTVNGNVNVRMSGGNAYSLYGGGKGSVAGGIYLTMTGGKVAQVFGANDRLNYAGDVVVLLQGGTITRRFFGGCYNECNALGSYSTNYHVTGHIDVYIDDGMDFAWTQDQITDDLGMYAHSRHKEPNGDEIASIYYMDAAVQSACENKLGNQGGTMSLAMGSATTADELSVLKTTVREWNVVLGDSIGANFYMKVPQAIAEVSVVNVTVADQTQTYDLSKYKPNAKGLYLIPVSVAAAQMTEDITLQLVVDCAECEAVSYSVRKYAEYILEGDYSTETETLVKHMLDYGTAAQNYFLVNTGNPANTDYVLNYVAQLPDSYPKMTVNGQISGIQFVGASLIIDSRIAVRYYFTDENALEGVTFTADRVRYDAQKKSNMFYVEVPGILPNEYADPIVLSAVKGDETLTVSYSPLTYIVRMSSKGSNTLKALVNAMYGYHEAAVAYVSNRSLFTSDFDTTIWDITGQHDGYVTVIGGGGDTNVPLQFAGQYQNVDLTLNARDYADSDTQSRTEFGFEFDVDGDGVINTAKGDQTVTFGIAQGDRIQTRGGTLLNWKTPYELSAAEKAQLVIDTDEVAAGNEDGLDLRVIRYGTMIYLFVENKQVAVCDLTKCANSSGDTKSGITADTKMFIYLRHYDDTRDAGVQIPFSITTNVLPVEITAQAENGTVSTTNTVNCYINNGRTTTTSDIHFPGENVTLTTTAAGEEYMHIHTKLNGEAVTLTDGTCTFTATEDSYEVESIFRKKLFVDNADAKWDLSQQNLGTVTVDGIQKTQGIATLIDGGTNTVAFRDKYTDIDITITAKENYTTSGKPGRTDILFEFDTNNDGTIDKSVSFGILKNDDGVCRVRTLGNWNNYIPSDRHFVLHELSEAEAEKYLTGGGVELRVIRKGTNVIVLLEGKVVNTFDLTQNSSGVTADMKAKVTLRHYDAIAPKVVIPFTVTDQLASVTVTDISSNGTVTTPSNSLRVGDTVKLSYTVADGYYLKALKVDGTEVTLAEDGTYTFTAIKATYTVEGVFEKIGFTSGYNTTYWDVSGLDDGYVTAYAGGTNNPLQFAGQYQNVDLTLNARDYADAAKVSRTEFGFEFDVDGDGVIDTAKGDQTVTFGIAEGNRIQTRGGTLLSWKTPYDLSAAEKAQLVIDADEVAAGNEDGLDLRVVRYGTTIYLFIENKQVAICDLTKCANASGDTESGITADTKMFIYLRHYDDTRDAGVQIPFSITTNVVPVEITAQAENGTVSTTNTVYCYRNNSRNTTTSDIHFREEYITLTATAASEAYLHIQTTLNGEAVTLTDGAYSFTATENSYEVESVYRKKLFVDNADAKWDLSQQNLGTVVIDGIEKTQGIATLIDGGSKTVAFRDQYTYIDLAVTAKENKTPTETNGGRTDILFEFDTNNDGTIDKSVSFGIVKWTTSCIVETLGNSSNYIPADRKNTLYTLNAAETEAYLADGVELRVIRDGTNVHVMLEGNLVNTFDLTQNNSGVTADMPAKVTLRHYDAKPDKVVIPFVVTDKSQQMIFKNTYDSSIWDVSGQYDGLVVLPNGGGSTAAALEFYKKYTNVDLSLTVRDYPDGDKAADARTDVEFIFDNGETVTFGVVKTGSLYRIQNRAGTLLSWKTPYFITDQSMIDDYVVTEEELSSGNPGGLNFRIVRYGTEFYLYLNDTMVKGYDFSYEIAADTPVTLKLRHYDDAGFKVEIPFAITEDVTVEQLRLFAEKEAVNDYAYSFAVLPDTQIVTENDVKNGQANLAKLYDWIIANKESKNIQYVFGLGDITDNNNAAEWTLAQTQFAKLTAAGIPYSAIRGNHDLAWYGKTEGAENYTTDDYTNYIGTEAYRAQFSGFYSDTNVSNSWRTLQIGDVKYLLITLDYGADDAVLNWASGIIYQHPDHNVIITTHAYLYRDGTTLDSGDNVPPSTSGGTNDGDDMWEKLVSKHENIVLVMSGHDPSESIVVNRSKGNNGNTVTAMLIDAQDVEAQEGSMGMVAMLYFSADGKTMQVEYYSTAKEKYFISDNQFTLTLDTVDAASESTVPATGAYTNTALTEGSAYTTAIADEQKVTLSESLYTLSAWINLSTSVTDRAGVILGNYSDSIPNCLNFEIYSNGHPRLYHRNASNATDSLVFDDVDIRSDTNWVHLVFTISGNQVSCYVNGELKQTLTATKTIQLESTISDFVIGGDLRTNNGSYFKGRILHLDLYSGILSAEKILSLYVDGTEAVTEGKILSR